MNQKLLFTAEVWFDTFPNFSDPVQNRFGPGKSK